MRRHKSKPKQHERSKFHGQRTNRDFMELRDRQQAFRNKPLPRGVTS
jgi:hypothetical protein